MFPASSTDQRPIAPSLLEQARKIEERSPSLQVLAAREFRYPAQQQAVKLRAERYRQLNLLEKFVLRAYAEITPPPSFGELADALGLDPLFLRSTFNDLVSLQNISKSQQVTAEGRKSLSSETISEGSEFDTWYLMQDLVEGGASFSRYPLAAMDNDEFEDISPYVQKDLKQFPAFEFQPTAHQLQDLGLDFHNPDENRFVTEMEPAGEPQLCWKRIAIFVLYDTLSENADKSITFQARSKGQLLPMVAQWLASQLQQQRLSLKEFCGLDDDVFAQEEKFRPAENTEMRQVEARLEEIQRQAVQQLRLKVEGQMPVMEVGTALQLRDVEIRPAFLKALQNAREQIIIYSPWINEQVVDDEFLALMEDLVERGVHILIGYGIGRDEEKEGRSMPPHLRQRLRSIMTAEGTPGVVVEWLGNSHAKEIIIDGKMHFSGSHNWLSYRGDRFPRGETVYQVTIAAEVEKAHKHLAQRFLERAQTLWSKATEDECYRVLCILCYLWQEQAAMFLLQRDARYHLVPFWLRLARQTIAAGHEARILTPLHRVIMLCRTVIEPQAPLRTEIVSSLRDILSFMMQKNQKLTTNFISNNYSELMLAGLWPL